MRTAEQTGKLSDRVRSFVERNYVRPARARGDSRFTVVAGEVHREMRLVNRMPAICSALRTTAFLRENQVKIVEEVSPASGMSSTVAITYEFTNGNRPNGRHDRTGDDPLLALRGIAKELFSALGGGEHFIRSERKAWDEKEGRK